MFRRRWAFGLVVVAVAALTVAMPAAAGKPTLERVDFVETIDDVELAELCGLPQITTTVKGHFIDRVYPDGSRLVSLHTVSIRAVAVSEFGRAVIMDSGNDGVRVTRTGEAELSIVGQIPFQWFGVLKVNLDTGEVTHEPTAGGEDQLERVCAKLSPRD